MIISDIKKELKKYKIYIDDAYCCFLYEKEFSKLGLFVDQSLSKEMYETIIDIPLHRGYQYMVHLLAKKDYTKFELNRKLMNAGYSQDLSRSILKDIENRGWLQEERYGKRLVEQNMQSKSKKQIQFILENKGFNKKLIEELFKNMEIDETNALRKLMTKKIREQTEFTYEDKNKLYQYGYSRGFERKMIVDIVDEILKNNKEKIKNYVN